MRFCFASIACYLSLIASALAADPPAVVTAPGAIEPQSVVEIVATMAAKVEQIGVELSNPNKQISFASKVQRGMVLVQFDSTAQKVAVTTAQSDLQRATAELELARAQVEVAQVDLRQKSKVAPEKPGAADEIAAAKSALAAAQTAVQSRESSVESEKLRLARAKTDLDRCVVCSPIDGTILDDHLGPGQASMVNPNDLMFRIIDDSKGYQIRVVLASNDVAKVRPGQPVRFTTDASPNRTFTGSVMRALPNSINAGGEVRYNVLVGIDDESGVLLPYMKANVEIDVSKGN